MHHWTVHAKVEFQKFPPDVRSRGVHSTTFDPELRNEFKKFSNPGGFTSQLFTLNSEINLKIFLILGGSIPQLLILNSEMNLKICPILRGSIPQLLISNSEMNLKIFPFLWGVYSTSFDSELRNKFQNFPIPGGPFHQMGPFTRFDTFPILLCASP